jgi:hypothetical protein
MKAGSLLLGIAVVIMAIAAVTAERYALGDGWVLEANTSLFPVSDPLKIEVPAKEIATISWLLFPPLTGDNATMLFISWGNYSNLDVALGITGVTTSIFGSVSNQLGATAFNTDENTRVSCLGADRYGIEAYNKTTREVKGYYVPVTLAENDNSRIMALWATNITLQQWREFLSSISLNQTADGATT